MQINNTLAHAAVAMAAITMVVATSCLFVLRFSNMRKIVAVIGLLTLFPQASVLAAEDYRLQQADVISMSIYQEDDMQTQSLIGKSGTVSFPLVGAVEVKGLTVPELEKKLKDLYEKDYLVNAQVNIIIVSYAKKWISVSGAVENPGNVPYPEEGTVNLASALAMAGGVMEDGNSRSITVARKKGGSQKYSLESSGKVILQPGDTVVVARLPREPVDRMTTVSGEVRSPGSIKLPASGKVDILTAVAQAGGFSKVANQKECTLQRKTKSGYTKTDLNLRDIRGGKAPMAFLYEGDILIIKESRF